MPLPERQDSWENDGFPRDPKPAVAAQHENDFIDPWASDPEDATPVRKVQPPVAAAEDDLWGDDTPTVTAAQWKAAPNVEPKRVEEQR